MAKTDYQSIDEYIAAQPASIRPTLEKVRGAIKKGAPGAEEVISYQVPAFKLHGGFVMYFSGHTKHFSLSCPPPFVAFEALKDELAPYRQSKSAVRFPLDKPVPVGLIQRMAKANADALKASAKAKPAKPAPPKPASKATTASAPAKRTAADAAYRGLKTVDAYIAKQPEAARPVLEQVRATLRKALPRAEESISYNMPAYKQDGQGVVYFAGWKQHFSLYPITDAIAQTFEAELAPYEVSGSGTVRIPLAARLPTKLVTSIAKARLAEVKAGAPAPMGTARKR